MKRAFRRRTSPTSFAASPSAPVIARVGTTRSGIGGCGSSEDSPVGEDRVITTPRQHAAQELAGVRVRAASNCLRRALRDILAAVLLRSLFSRDLVPRRGNAARWRTVYRGAARSVREPGDQPAPMVLVCVLIVIVIVIDASSVMIRFRSTQGGR